MFFRNRRLFVIAMALSVVLIAPLIASCGGQSGATATPGAGTTASLAADQSFTFNNGAEPETLDPAIMTGDPEVKIIMQILEGLTTYDPKDLSPKPGMAERWDVSPDGLTYTFHLRDAKWSNGDKVTADDFVYSWQRALSPTVADGAPSPYAYQLYYLKGGEDFNSGKITDFSQVGVKAKDPKTLEVTLANPTPFFLYLTSFQTYMPVNKTSVEKFGKDWTKPGNYVTNGAFLLKDWKPQQEIDLERNPDYWDAANVKLTKVKILPLEDTDAALAKYQKGEVDWVRTIPPDKVPQWKDKPDAHLTPSLSNYFYRFNVTKPPFDKSAVRKAFDMAIDKESIVKNVTNAGESAAKGFVPPSTPGYKSVEDQGLTYDPAQAKKLLADAGYPDGKGFPKVTLLYSTSPRNKAVAEAIQQMWKQNLGVEVELLNQEWKVYLQSQATLDYNIAPAGWGADYPDPKTFLDMFVTDGGNNQTGWSNKQYDDLIAKSQTAKTADRMKVFQDAEKILVVDEMPIAPIFYDVNRNLVKTYVKGMEYNPLDVFYMKYVSIEKH